MVRYKMNQIVTKTTSRETINAILERMQNPIEVAYYRLSRKRFTTPVEHANLSIRWGCTPRVDTEIEINSREAVKLASDKGRCRDFLSEKGIPIPQAVDLTNLSDDDFPLVVRPSFHQKGRGFLFFNNLFEFRERIGEVLNLNRPYASRFFPKSKEYRVHVGHGKVLLVQEKVRDFSGQIALNWNRENGYAFGVVPWKDYRSSIVRIAVDTIEAVGLDFGAVDILADPTNSGLPNAVVCEVNTAPKLEGYTAERYAEYFDWIIDNEETRHFEIPEQTRARHYVFKHRELRDNDYDFDFI